MNDNQESFFEGGILALVGLMLLKELQKGRKPSHQKTQLIFTAFINHYQIKILKMQLEKQSFADTILKIVDHATGDPIDATFDNVVLESSDEAIFTCNTDVNNDGKVDVVGVSVGDANLKVTADATYVDANTKETVTKSKTAMVPVFITAPPPEAQETDLIVSFTAPEPLGEVPAAGTGE